MYHSTSKILDGQALQRRLAGWRVRRDRIVFTNGCFDLLHPGHIDYLEKARALGDRLVIGLNTDASVTRLKGPGRPVNDESSRARLLAALQAVDAVSLFPQDTPYELIQLVKPDVLVKGGDYKIEEIVGADFVQARGGVVTTLDFLPGYSSSQLIEKIRKER